MNNIFKYFNNNSQPNISCEEAISNIFWYRFEKYGPKDLDEKPSSWFFIENRSFGSDFNIRNQPQCGLSAEGSYFNESRLKEILKNRKPEEVNIKISDINIVDKDKNLSEVYLEMNYKRN